MVMKTRFYMLLVPVILCWLTSCSPIYRCGDPVPDRKLSGSKRLKTVVLERDALCNDLAAKVKENSSMNADLDDLNRKHSALVNQSNSLQKKYETLISENLSQADQFNKALQAKSEELDRKESILAEREQAMADMRRIIDRQDSLTRRLNDILHNALLGFNPDELSVEIKNGKVYVSMTDKLLFKSGSVAVEVKGKEALKLLADVLDKNKDIDILVEGHTDNVPINTAVYKDNWDLSVGRATSIVRILTREHRIDPTQLTASGKGEFYPRAGNDTAEGRARNRRTEIILSPKLDVLMQLLNNKI